MTEAFRAFFLDDALPAVKEHDGLLAVQVGLPLDERSRRFLMITTWRSLDARVGFTGENWREAVIDSREEHLLEAVSVEHFAEEHGERIDL
jgi:heme-degrading monooxygenase HmoA